MKINSFHLRRSFGEVKLSSSSRATLKNGGLSGGLSQMPGGLSQMSGGLNHMPGGLNQTPGGPSQMSIKQEASSSLLAVIESQV